jgi:hypothetical protein
LHLLLGDIEEEVSIGSIKRIILRSRICLTKLNPLVEFPRRDVSLGYIAQAVRERKPMFKRIIPPLAFLAVVFFLAEFSHAQRQAKHEEATNPVVKERVSALVESLKDKDFAVHYAAARALHGIGPAAKTAVPALIEALKDKDPLVRSISASA